MRVVILGAPGAGKGSQATRVCEHFGVPHISTGDAFRSNIARGTDIGLYAKSFMDKGQLVPDEVVVKIVGERLSNDDCKSGFLLDGFPRTITQAEALENITKLDAVINLNVNIDIIIKRLTGRRSCSCGETYHIDLYSEDTCAKCGKKLYVREDDKEDTIRNRLDVYQSSTAPLIDFYRDKGLLIDVDGNKFVTDVTAEVIEKLSNI